MKRNYSLSTLLLCAACAISTAAQWTMQEIKTTASLRGLSTVNANVVWASGTGGTVLRTINGGATWDVIQVPTADKLEADQLDFRDIEAFDEKTAYILSIGNGAASRIYKTTDGGKTWWLSYQNTNEQAFFDAIAFWDKDHGLAMSDPVNGRFLILTTDDGGKSWRSIEKTAMPEALAGEGGFAASGTCLITQGKQNAFLVSGGNTARVYRSTNRGRTWQVSATPLRKDGTAAGAFSIVFKDDKVGMIVGGDYQKPDDGAQAAAFTQDGGKTWTLLDNQPY
ncbi:MAG: glycosyl hydrolase, partial [Acidobacteria bacterium]|nr:glycosyl hydrolase [Acidobacteriota bacterium]